MSISKICTLILFYFLSRVAAAATCETFSGYAVKEQLCWDDKLKGWLSESCQKKKCEARAFLERPAPKVTPDPPVGGQNPATLYCHSLKLPVVILRDARGNEQSFCSFKDGSLADPNAIERHLRK